MYTTGTGAHGQCYRNSNCKVHPHAYAQSNTYTSPYVHPNPKSHARASSYVYSYGCTDREPRFNPCANTDSYLYPGVYSCANRITHCYAYPSS